MLMLQALMRCAGLKQPLSWDASTAPYPYLTLTHLQLLNRHELVIQLCASTLTQSTCCPGAAPYS